MNESLPKEEIYTSIFEIETGYESYIPEDFRENPLTYFETHGKNIKQGEIEYHTDGTVSEDPTAVKDFPVWENGNGDRLFTVGKRVNLDKGMINKTKDPFYEYMIMKIVQQKNLPGAKPIVKISQGNSHLIIMERIPGLRWSYRHELLKKGFTNEDVDRLHKKAEAMMSELQKRFEREGIMRDWKLSDMVFDIDIENKDLRSLTPVDWERTKIL